MEPEDRSGLEPSDDDYGASQTGFPLRHSNQQFEWVAESPRSSPLKGSSAPRAKWDDLKANYDPAYLSLFRGVSQEDPVDFETSDFDTTQLGAVTWTASDKTLFFRCLERYGRHDLRRLASGVGTKSEVEVQAYMSALQQAEVDRQLYSRQTNNISIAEIPAAFEIDEDLEEVLDEAAASLEAYQEQYDYAVAARGSGIEYIVNKDVAKQLDARTDQLEQDIAEGGSSYGRRVQDHPEALLNVSMFVDLSTTLFMQGSGARADQQQDDWTLLAYDDETPAITQDALSDLSHLLISLVQRIVQTSIFLTESRIRATTTRQWQPLKVVGSEDVQTTLQVLNCEKSLWSFWIRWARRRGLRVVSGSHRKKTSEKRYLDYDEVETALSQPAYRGRNSRSASRASTSSMSDDSVSTNSEDSGAYPSSPPSSGSSARGGDGDSSDQDTDHDEYDQVSGPDHDERQPQGEFQENNESREQSSDEEMEFQPGVEPTPKYIRLPPAKRKRILEEDLEDYMEDMDGQHSREEQHRIRKLLSPDDTVYVKEESEGPSKRPKTLRKTVEEARGWQVPPIAAWEVYQFVPEESGEDAAEKRTKREPTAGSELSL